jgi:hypothetical protein
LPLKIAFELTCAAVLMRGWRAGLPWFCLAVAADAVLNLHYLLVLNGLTRWQESAAWDRVWAWALPLAPLARAFAAAEAYQRILAPEFWPQARWLGRYSQMVALAVVLGLIAAVGFRPPSPGAGSWLIGAGSWLKLWTALWFGIALLWQWLWPGMRFGFIRHAVILEGLLLSQAVGSVGRIGGATWGSWHALNGILYGASILLLAVWAWLVPPQEPRSARPARLAASGD